MERSSSHGPRSDLRRSGVPMSQSEPLWSSSPPSPQWPGDAWSSCSPSTVGRRCRGFTAEDYGDQHGLREWLNEQRINYVLAVSCRNARFTTTSTGPRQGDELPPSARCAIPAGCRLRRGQQGRASRRLGAHSARRWRSTYLLAHRSSPRRANWPPTSARAAHRCRTRPRHARRLGDDQGRGTAPGRDSGDAL